MLKKKYYDGTQVHRIISEEVKDYDTIMKILKRFADEPSALGTDLAEVGTDTISRQAAIDALDVLCQEHRYKIPGKRETYSQYNEAWQDALDRAEGVIFNLPTAQPMRKKGRWIDTGSIEEWWAEEFKCSECGESMLGTANYCPNCGAKMEVQDGQ